MTADGSDRAHAYAAWARSGRDASFAPVVALLLDLLPSPSLGVLDVGCGEGRVGAELTKRGYVVEGVDIEPAMVELAREHHPAALADATSLPFPDGSFETVVSIHALMEVDDLDAALRENARVLVPGGVFVAIVKHPFASGRKVDRYSDVAHYRWETTHDGADLGLGGIHRPLGHYVSAFDRAGFALDTLREASVGRFDPLSLAIRASLPFG
jgi:SAM-dependent methyltransferase